MNNLRAMIFMIVGMATFAAGDAMLKLSSQSTPTGLVLITMGASGCLIFFTVCVLSGNKVFSRLFFHPIVMLRNLFEASAAYFLFQALALTELSTVAAILQAIPLILTLCAAIFLRETIGPRRWAAVAIGLLGVLIIIQPSSEGLKWADILAVLGAVSLALRDLASRLAPAEATTPLLSTYAFSMLVPVGILVNLSDGAPWHIPSEAYTPLVLLVAFSVTGYYCVTTAMRVGDVSAVSPLRYFRLPFATVLAIILFSETPDTATILGAALVVGSGLFVMLREAQIARRQA